MPVALLAHRPPVPLVDKVVDEATHTSVAPVIVTPAGKGFTVTFCVAAEVPHILDKEYEMITVPAARPVTSPPPPTMAFTLLALHTPPVPVVANVIVDPTQTVENPVIKPASGKGITVR
jgi:hypothetical protein